MFLLRWSEFSSLCPDTLHRKLLATAVEPGTSQGEASDQLPQTSKKPGQSPLKTNINIEYTIENQPFMPVPSKNPIEYTIENQHKPTKKSPKWAHGSPGSNIAKWEPAESWALERRFSAGRGRQAAVVAPKIWHQMGGETNKELVVSPTKNQSDGWLNQKHEGLNAFKKNQLNQRESGIKAVNWDFRLC